MVDMHSATIEIARGTKKKEEERRRNHRAKNIMSESATQVGHKNAVHKCRLHNFIYNKQFSIKAMR